MMLSIFSSRGWESWALSSRPLIPERMPVLVDDDLRFEDAATALRPTTVVNRWLRELPASGCPAPSSWESYARVLLEWMRFLDEHDVELFDSRNRLKGPWADIPSIGRPARSNSGSLLRPGAGT